MKIVTMCRGGHVRSVGLKFILRYSYGHDVIACGWEGNAAETREMLFKWADYIVVLMKGFEDYVPVEFRPKTFCYDVGEDVFGNPFHPQLQAALKGMIQKHGLFSTKVT